MPAQLPASALDRFDQLLHYKASLFNELVGLHSIIPVLATLACTSAAIFLWVLLNRLRVQRHSVPVLSAGYLFLAFCLLIWFQGCNYSGGKSNTGFPTGFIDPAAPASFVSLPESQLRKTAELNSKVTIALPGKVSSFHLTLSGNLDTVSVTKTGAYPSAEYTCYFIEGAAPVPSSSYQIVNGTLQVTTDSAAGCYAFSGTTDSGQTFTVSVYFASSALNQLPASPSTPLAPTRSSIIALNERLALSLGTIAPSWASAPTKIPTDLLHTPD